jgi:hypothetical protein
MQGPEVKPPFLVMLVGKLGFAKDDLRLVKDSSCLVVVMDEVREERRAGGDHSAKSRECWNVGRRTADRRRRRRRRQGRDAEDEQSAATHATNSVRARLENENKSNERVEQSTNEGEAANDDELSVSTEIGM